MSQYLVEVLESPVFARHIEKAETILNQGDNEEGVVVFTLVRGSAGQFKYEELFELFGEELHDKEDFDACQAFLEKLTEKIKEIYSNKGLVMPFPLVVEEDSNDGDIVIKAYAE
jgi:uncharacterized protein YqgQ